MITVKGEALFMNNVFKETKNYLKYLAVGDNDTTPQYTDTSLTHEVTRTEATISYNPSIKALTVSADFEVENIENCCEIGVITTNGDLLTHDLFNSLPSGYDSTIHLEYRISLEPFIKVLSWKQTKYVDVYVSLIDTTVQAVYEKATHNGYTVQKNVEAVQSTIASYYYDSGSKQLYIHPSTSIDPASLDIHILTR